MDKLNGDLITHIGKFVSFEDRLNCIHANKALSKINGLYTHHIWKSLNTSLKNKYDALIKYKPLLNSLKIEIGNECIVDIHEADYLYVASRVKNIEIKITHNIHIIDRLMSIAEKNDIFINLSVKVVALNTIIPLFHIYPSVMLNDLNVVVFNDKNDLLLFCKLNKTVARVRSFTIDRPLIDVSDLKTINSISLIIKNYPDFHKSIYKIATNIDCDLIIGDNGLGRMLLDDFCKCEVLKKLVLQGLDIRDILLVKDLNTLFLKMLVSTNCVLTLCPYSIQDPMIIPFIKYIFKNTSNHIKLLTGNDNYDLYINMIVLHCNACVESNTINRLSLSKPCTVKKSYKDTLSDLYDLNPEAHEMWSVLKDPL